MLGPSDDIHRLLPGGVQTYVAGGLPPTPLAGSMVGPPVTAFPGVSPAVPVNHLCYNAFSHTGFSGQKDRAVCQSNRFYLFENLSHNRTF